MSYDFDPREIEAFKILQGVTARALADDDYRHRLYDDPKSVLAEAGLEMPECMEVAVHQNRAGMFHLVLPEPLPADQQLDLDSLNLRGIGFWWPI